MSYSVIICNCTEQTYLWLQGVLAVYIEMTGKKVDKGNDLKDQLCCMCSIDPNCAIDSAWQDKLHENAGKRAIELLF